VTDDATAGFRQFARAGNQRPRVGRGRCRGGTDATVLAALAQARDWGWVRPIVTDDAAAIAATAERAGIDMEGSEVVASEIPADAAVEAVEQGRAALLMNGEIDTPLLVRALLDPKYGLRRGRTICRVVLMEIVDQNRRFLLADTGVTIQPTLEQTTPIIENTIGVARAVGAPEPRIALVAATEKVNPAMPETVEIAELCRLHAEGAFAGAIVHGPLSFDLAYAFDAGQKKQIAGDVGGAADALVFPNLLSANLTVKGIIYIAGCRFGGVLAGAGCPVVFMSGADTVETRVHSLAMALTVHDVGRG
jgi:phosphate butyryltransferase